MISSAQLSAVCRLSGLCTIIWLAMVACVGVSNNELSRAKTIAYSKEQFAALPFGFELTVENIERHYGKALKVEHYLINDQPEEIYRFFRGKTEIFFLKPHQSDVQVVSGNIYLSTVKLNNGICVGISRKEFFWKFSDWLYDSAETLTLHSPAIGCSFKFVFAKNKLKSIHIDNRISQLEMRRKKRVSDT
jgi:hypothetical protein